MHFSRASRYVFSAGCLLLAGLTSAGAQTAPASRPASAAAPTAKASASKPLWTDLTAAQQQALQPLAPHWGNLSEAHKRKWLVLSRNYTQLETADRTLLHSRMTEWAALSPQQRSLARLNFAEVKRLPADERKAKWDEYQALSEEEKRRLAERAPAKPRGAAVPIRPVSSQKLVRVPPVTPSKGQHTPRLQPAAPAPAAPTLPTPARTAIDHPPAIPPLRLTEQPSSAP